MRLDVVIRAGGSSRSPGDHVSALLKELEAGATVLMTPPFAGEGYDVLTDPESLNLEAPMLLYGNEQLLGQVRSLPVDTVWMVVGGGSNPLRNIWKLRGAHPWIGSVNLALLLEDAESTGTVESSPLATNGRVAKVVVMQKPAEAPPADAPLEAVAAAAMELADVEPPDVVEETPEIASVEGAEEEMSLELVQDTQKALLSRYALVRERRSILARTAEVDEQISELLREVFAVRFNVAPEQAGAFAELTGKLAGASAEYRDLVTQRAQVEQQLEALAWLKAELEM